MVRNRSHLDRRHDSIEVQRWRKRWVSKKKTDVIEY